jgi:hypothetical protein
MGGEPVSEGYCWGIFREQAHSPGRETDDSEILRLTGKHLEARGFRVVVQSPEEVTWPLTERPRGVFFMCERLEILGHLREIGVGSGWRCWEVGAGGMSVPLWLAAQVGPTGLVLATDIDTSLLTGPGSGSTNKYEIIRPHRPRRVRSCLRSYLQSVCRYREIHRRNSIGVCIPISSYHRLVHVQQRHGRIGLAPDGLFKCCDGAGGLMGAEPCLSEFDVEFSARRFLPCDLRGEAFGVQSPAFVERRDRTECA